MTKERACANDETRPVCRVESHVNDELRGDVFHYKEGYDARNAKVMEHRQRQEAYFANLPKEPLEAIREINSVLRQSKENERLADAPSNALYIIQTLAMTDGIDESQQTAEAFYWLAEIARSGLMELEEGFRAALDISAQFNETYIPYRA